MSAIRLACPTPYKEVFASKQAARHVIKAMQRRSKRQKGNCLAQEVYECRCGGVHLAHPKRNPEFRQGANGWHR